MRVRTCILCVWAATLPAYASAILNSRLELRSLQISSFDGNLIFTTPIGASVFTEALDTTGELDQKSDSVEDGDVSAGSSTSLGSASATASAVRWTASVTGGSGLNSEAGVAGTARSALYGAFEVAGVTGPVEVMFTADLAYSHGLATGGGGTAESELAFALVLDNGEQPLFRHNRLQITGLNTATSTFDDTIIGTAMLSGSTQYQFYARLDDEYRMHDTPEPSALLLMVAGVSAIVVSRWAAFLRGAR